MPTRNIEFSIGEYYHIYSRGVDKRPIFLDDRDRERFVKLLYIANSDSSVHLSNYQGWVLASIPKGKCTCAIGAWCLMPNHLHLLMKEIIEGGISRFLHRLLVSYSMYFNKKYDRKGTLFETRFKVKHLNTDEYLKYIYSYIHLNPIGIIDSGWKQKVIADKVKAKDFLEKYPYSSYQDYSGVVRPEGAIINKAEFPEYFSLSINFGEMINEWMNFDD